MKEEESASCAKFFLSLTAVLTYHHYSAHNLVALAAPFGRSASRVDQRECYKSQTFAGDMFKTTSHSVASNQYTHQREWGAGTEGVGMPGTKASGTAKYNWTHKSAISIMLDTGDKEGYGNSSLVQTRDVTDLVLQSWFAYCVLMWLALATADGTPSWGSA